MTPLESAKAHDANTPPRESERVANPLQAKPTAEWECKQCGQRVRVAGEAVDVWCPNHGRTMPRMTPA